MTGGSEKVIDNGDEFYLGELENWVWTAHRSERGRGALLAPSATLRAQPGRGLCQIQTEFPKAKYLLSTNSVKTSYFLFPTEFHVSLLGKRTPGVTFINRTTWPRGCTSMHPQSPRSLKKQFLSQYNKELVTDVQNLGVFVHNWRTREFTYQEAVVASAIP